MGARSMPAIVAVILELVLLSQAESSKKSVVFRFTPVLQPVSGQARECRGLDSRGKPENDWERRSILLCTCPK